jgi:flagellar biosynthetic protein FliO
MAEPAFAIGELVKLVFALGVTIGLFYALALFMKRMQVGTGKGSGLITVLAAQPLGAKEKIWVVEIAGERLVVGTSPGHVNCLHVLREGSAADMATEPSEGTPSSFRRRPESSVVGNDMETTLDPGLRRGDGSAFSDLLLKFRGGNKP